MEWQAVGMWDNKTAEIPLLEAIQEFEMDAVWCPDQIHRYESKKECILVNWNEKYYFNLFHTDSFTLFMFIKF